MPYSVMEALFYGRIAPSEQCEHMNGERKAIEERIKIEKQYFLEKMSLDDCKRFMDLEDLYGKAAYCEEVDFYSQGFRLGALLMLEVMENKNTITSE